MRFVTNGNDIDRMDYQPLLELKSDGAIMSLREAYERDKEFYSQFKKGDPQADGFSTEQLKAMGLVGYYEVDENV